MKINLSKVMDGIGIAFWGAILLFFVTDIIEASKFFVAFLIAFALGYSVIDYIRNRRDEFSQK
jgi:hypothetical protein